jgi:hypothetical protein
METFFSLPDIPTHQPKPLINYLFVFRTPANVDNNQIGGNLVGLDVLAGFTFMGSIRRLIAAGPAPDDNKDICFLPPLRRSSINDSGPLEGELSA